MPSRSREYRLRLRVEHVLDALGAAAVRWHLHAVGAWLAQPLTVGQSLRAQRFVIILSGGIRSTGQLNEASRVRVRHGVRLFKNRFAQTVIMSGGRRAPHRPNGAQYMKRLAEELGIPADHILVEDQSSRTEENAREVSQILTTYGENSALLVTSPIHMRRAKLCFEKQGIAISAAPAYPISSRIFRVRPRMFKEVFHEYLGLLYYRIQGWI